MKYKVLNNLKHSSTVYSKDSVVDGAVLGEAVEGLVRSGVLVPAEEGADTSQGTTAEQVPPAQPPADEGGPANPAPLEEADSQPSSEPTPSDVASSAELENGPKPSEDSVPPASAADDGQPIPVNIS